MYRLGDYIEGVPLVTCALHKIGGSGLTGKQKGPHFRILCLQGNHQIYAIHAGKMHIYDCELRNPLFGFQQCESRFSGLSRMCLIPCVRKNDGKRLRDDTLIVNY